MKLISLEQILVNWLPGSQPQPWTWDEEELDILRRVCCCRSNRMVKGSIDRQGYIRVNICQNKYCVIRPVHRLVAFAFVDGYFEGAVVRHIDGYKSKQQSFEFRMGYTGRQYSTRLCNWISSSSISYC